MVPDLHDQPADKEKFTTRFIFQQSEKKRKRRSTEQYRTVKKNTYSTVAVSVVNTLMYTLMYSTALNSTLLYSLGG